MNIFHIGLTCSKFCRVVCNSRRLLFRPNRLLNKNKNILTLGFITVIPTISAHELNIKDGGNDNSSSLTIKSNEIQDVIDLPAGIFKDQKTPWERVKAIYEEDEFGNYSKELITTLHSCYMAMFVGFIYGGVERSRRAYVDFMERNQATLFDNHLDAKRKLQNHVTIHFGKGAFQWGWRLTAFTGGFTLMFFTLHAYRGTTSLLDYTASGALIGAIMRLKLGPPGIVIGGVVGGVLGLLSGLTNETILHMYGTSYDEMLAFHYRVDRERSLMVEEASAKTFEESGEIPKETFEMLKSHDKNSKEIP